MGERRPRAMIKVVALAALPSPVLTQVARVNFGDLQEKWSLPEWVPLIGGWGTDGEDSYECGEGLQAAPANVPEEQLRWCCQNKGVWCPAPVAPTTTTSGPFDCSELDAAPPQQPQSTGVPPRRAADEALKRLWCCQYEDIGCPKDPQATGTPALYDCQDDTGDWRKSWSDEKKRWCCAHGYLGCADDVPRPAAREPPKGDGCDARCTVQDFTTTCHSWVQKWATEKFVYQVDPCASAQRMVREECPRCSSCDLQVSCPKSHEELPEYSTKAPSESEASVTTIGSTTPATSPASSHTSAAAKKFDATTAESQRNATSRTPASSPGKYDCHGAGPSDDKNLWPQEKQAWCCQHYLVACFGCDVRCVVEDVSATCAERVAWTVDHRFADKKDACSLAHDLVSEDCPVCSGCELTEVCDGSPDITGEEHPEAEEVEQESSDIEMEPEEPEEPESQELEEPEEPESQEEHDGQEDHQLEETPSSHQGHSSQGMETFHDLLETEPEEPEEPEEPKSQEPEEPEESENQEEQDGQEDHQLEETPSSHHQGHSGRGAETFHDLETEPEEPKEPESQELEEPEEPESQEGQDGQEDHQSEETPSSHHGHAGQGTETFHDLETEPEEPEEPESQELEETEEPERQEEHDGQEDHQWEETPPSHQGHSSQGMETVHDLETAPEEPEEPEEPKEPESQELDEPEEPESQEPEEPEEPGSQEEHDGQEGFADAPAYDQTNADPSAAQEAPGSTTQQLSTQAVMPPEAAATMAPAMATMPAAQPTPAPETAVPVITTTPPPPPATTLPPMTLPPTTPTLPPTTLPASTTRFVTPDPTAGPAPEAALDPYDCAVPDNGNDAVVQLWSPSRREWCCAHHDVGCAKEEEQPFDCTDGVLNWEHNWPFQKAQWCCQHYEVGCADDAFAPAQKFQKQSTQAQPLLGAFAGIRRAAVWALAGTVACVALYASVRVCSITRAVMRQNGGVAAESAAHAEERAPSRGVAGDLGRPEHESLLGLPLASTLV